DVGLETMDEDGHADLCSGWNAHDTTAAEPITVRYVVANAGTEPAADLVNCTVTESNAGFPAPGTVANPISGFACTTDTDCAASGVTCVSNHCVFTASPDNSALCSASLAAAEPDKATAQCTCRSADSGVTVSAFDEANFMCQTPGLTVTKQCTPTVAQCGGSATSSFTVSVSNSGSADLVNCTVTDTVFPGDTTCTNNPTAASVSPSTIASLPHGGAAVPLTGSAANLSSDSCNKVSVTCDIVGSVDPANPGHPKKITSTDHTTC